MAETSVTLLGTKGGPAVYPASDRMPTASLLRLGDLSVVIDCGLGVSAGLVRAGVHLRDLSVIVITHLHSDHYLELGPLLHTAWTAGLRTPVRVIGPQGLDAYWRGFLQSMAFDIQTRIVDEGRPDLAGLVMIEVMSDQVMLGLDASMKALRNQHPPITDSFALRFEYGGKSIVFSGDTAPFDGLGAFVTGADLLVHEAMFAEGVDRLVARVGNGDRLKQHLEASHTRAEDVGALAQSFGVKALALNHLVPSDDPAITDADWLAAIRTGGYEGPAFIGRDGLRITL